MVGASWEVVLYGSVVRCVNILYQYDADEIHNIHESLKAIQEKAETNYFDESRGDESEKQRKAYALIGAYNLIAAMKAAIMPGGLFNDKTPGHFIEQAANALSERGTNKGLCLIIPVVEDAIKSRMDRDAFSRKFVEKLKEEARIKEEETTRKDDYAAEGIPTISMTLEDAKREYPYQCPDCRHCQESDDGRMGRCMRTGGAGWVRLEGTDEMFCIYGQRERKHTRSYLDPRLTGESE